ncbi:MAG: hypothetical protein QOF48_1281 [Verrucomicrobiota bacterium]|jgi:hypothetical protein
MIAPARMVCLLGGLLIGSALMVPAQTVVINEIMYHPLQPQFGAEPLGEEFIELFNKGATTVNLNGWHFNKGIGYTFPNINLPAGGYLVVSPDTNAFLAHYGSIPGAILAGNWTGTLANNGETVELKDAAGNVIDSVTYATEGDWAIRQRGPNDLGHRGWKWYCEADGLGKSIERRNPNITGDTGQNWRFSAAANGTPGRVNAASTNNVAPFILNLAHSPIIPRPSQSVYVTARIMDETASGLSVTLFYAINPVSSPASFSSTTMFDDGAHGDGVAGDGIYGAIIAGQGNGTIVEFYVQASDSGGRVNTWPGAAIAAADTTGPTGQVANALYQVDNDPQNDFGVATPSQPVLKLIMTASENSELASIPGSAGNSDAEMNGTFIALDGISTEVRYRCGFRNRGHGSRTANPPNYRVNIPNEVLWKNQAALNINSVNTPAQVLGATIAKKGGLAGADSRAAQVRVNNVNRATSGTGMLGSYALNEELGSEWAAQHFPQDSAGNVYRAARDIAPYEWAYRGPLVNSYINTYFKSDNSSAYDWSDLIQLHRIVGTNDLFTTANVRQVANIEEWCRYYAIMALYGNTETSPNGGYNDDYFMYRGVNDPRFMLMYYDNDSILSSTFGAASTGTGIFTAEANNGMGNMATRFMEWPDFKPIYYATFQQLLNTTFSQPEFDSIVDEVMNTYPSGSSRESVRASVKSYMTSRRSTVQSLINGFVPPATNNPVATISGEPRSPSPLTTATLIVGGTGITHYKWKLNNGAFSAETPVATSISLSGLANGSTNTVRVVGRNASGIYQDPTNATASKTWIVNTATPKVRLSEILARNDSAVNHNATFPDIIELYNEGGIAIDLSGMRLTDDPATPGKFTFPPSTSLASGAYLLVYANNSDGTPGMHTGFSLDQDGDAVYLYDKVASGGALLDSVVFGLQLPNLSIGRTGTSGDWSLTTPTFGAANTAQALGNPGALKINEWFAASGALPFTDDFIEIYNPDPLPVALGGMYLSDEPIGAPALHRIANLSFAPAAGYVSFTADGNSDAGASHLGFQLDADIGEISLDDALLNVIDSVSYGPQRAGVSMGRCPDGSRSIVFLSFPTPRVGNACPTTPPAPVTIPLMTYTNVWRYESNNFDGLGWMLPGFNDSAWYSGPGVIGRLNPPSTIPEPVLTPISIGKTSYYFRTYFNVPANANITSLQLTHIIDDGCVLYLNGTEVYRYNLSGTVNNGTLASPVNGAPTYQGPFSISINNLMPGTNLIAVEVHQSTVTSADVFMGIKLDGLVVTNSATAAGVVINEVFARNASIAEPDGTTPDWVEIYNPSQTAVDLGDYSLSDSTLDSRRWIFPSPTIVSAQDYLVVRFNSGALSSPTNTGFGLKASGDSVYLFKKPADGGGVLSFVTFGLQIEDFSIGRVPSGSANWQLTIPSAASANSAAPTNDASGLKVNEWMAQPEPGKDDWFEIYNSSPQPVNVGGLWLSDNLSSAATRQGFHIPALSFIGTLTNAYQRFWADNNIAAGADHVNFSLKGTGEAVGVSYADGTLINGYDFGSQDVGVSEGRLPDGAATVVRFTGTATPGEGNYLKLANVVISEALSHTDLPLEDAVELQNLSGASVDLSGWYLSDSKSQLRKYLIPNGTVLGAGLFKVFYEYQFNDPNYMISAFSLSSSKGDQIYLSQATNGQLTGYRASVDFGPSQNGVSFGRYRNSQGEDHFVAMSSLSLGTAVTAQSPTNQNPLFRTGQGAANPYPKVGPIVISEIMYHPPDVVVPGMSTNDNLIEEFVELRNTSGSVVPLYDPASPTNGWRLRDAVDFTFTSSHSIAPGGHMIVVSFDPVTNASARAQFESRYGSNFILVGPYSGKLDNGSDSVELVKPDSPQADGSVPYVLVEKVVYQDAGAWPTNADGLGMSLQRISDTGYANDPTNWIAAAASPGPSGITDSDGDGMPDDWEAANNFDAHNAADAAQDADGDGMTNLQEYLAGTNPHNAASTLRLTATSNGASVTLSFLAVAGKTYTILYASSLPVGGNWVRFTDVPAQGVTGTFSVPDGSVSEEFQRFYRVVTPAMP